MKSRNSGYRRMRRCVPREAQNWWRFCRTTATVQPADLRLETINTRRPLTVYCNVTAFADNDSTLTNFTLHRIPRSGKGTQLLAMASRPAAGDGPLKLRTTGFQGRRNDSVVRLEERYSSLLLTLQRAGCDDATDYVCDVYVKNVSDGKTVKETYDERVHPEARPYWRSTISGMADEGIMRLICTAYTMTSADRFRWVWHKQKADGVKWQALSGRETVSYRTPDPPDYCNTPAKSTLTKALTTSDSNSKYRCYVEDVVAKTTYLQYAAYFNVGHLEAMDHTIYYTLGGVAVGLVLFVVIVLLSYYLIILPRRRKMLEKGVGQVAPAAPASGQPP
ncbi:hypothetical protein ACOMHN_012905 [Nucella lapillus]